LELKTNEIKELKKIIQASDKGGEDLQSKIDDFRQKWETSEQTLVALRNEKSEYAFSPVFNISQVIWLVNCIRFNVL
jgi:hypothetical protein